MDLTRSWGRAAVAVGCVGVLAILLAMVLRGPGGVRVSNVRVAVVAGDRVEILYDLKGVPAPGADVSVRFSDDGGATWAIVPSEGASSGDFGERISSGTDRRIVWKPEGDLPKSFARGAMRVAITAELPPELPGRITVELPDGSPLVLVRVRGGTFLMGSPERERGRQEREGPRHQVTISQDYYLGKYPVTQGQWEAVMGANPSYFSGGGSDCPVEQVSWTEVCGAGTTGDCRSTSFIGRLNSFMEASGRSVPGRFRLPTEAEWERAARAGTRGEFSFTVRRNWDIECGTFSAAGRFMWWCGNDSPHGTKPVGSKRPNPWGLHDMHGNVWEWVADWRGEYCDAPRTDPAGPSTGSYRVIRGGCWQSPASLCRSATRYSLRPDTKDHGVGFRLAWSR